MSCPQPFRADIDLPESMSGALLRGVRGNCPRCDNAPLFGKWLKSVGHCAACDQDWSIQQADDFPAYIGIFVVGHLLAPVVITMISTLGMSPWLTLAILLPVAIAILIAMLQPTKGAVIAFLWWRGIGAFSQERRSAPPLDPEGQDI